MKKSLLYFLIIFLSLNIVNAEYKLEKVSDKLNLNYFQKQAKIKKENLKQKETYKLILDDYNDIFLIQNWYYLPTKEYFENSKYIDYKIENLKNLDYIKDNNSKTFIEIDSMKTKEIILNFDKTLEANKFIIWNLNFDYKYHKISYYIWDKNNNFSKVSPFSIKDFSFDKLKIKFECLNPNNCLREKIKINDIIIKNKTKAYLFKSFFDSDINVYSNFISNSKINYPRFNNNYNDFKIDKNTKSIKVKLENSKDFKNRDETDFDSDWVLDNLDNCPKNFNPKQTDSDSDWIWDVCSDFDKDFILGYKDNCPYVYNPKQTDVNNNKIWDKCEFDKDKDSVFDSIDNCVTTKNPDQLDDDKDWIWNACDNCELYNPRQLDKNNNGIWDVCEDREKYEKENDFDKDSILDFVDNCKKTPNKDQLDSDGDSVWDACDNCRDIVNKNQLDKNENWIWDLCEDSDNDGIIWYRDNCVYEKNKDQKDDDNNWIWNACEDYDSDKILWKKDNCPYKYNPKQEDIDKDWIWDACDEKDDRFLESNKYFIIAFIIFITIVFWIAIFFMIRKLK